MGKKSISELWEHFWPYVNSNPYIVGSDEWQRWVNAVSHIRAELLERCKNDWGILPNGLPSNWASRPAAKATGYFANEFKELGAACTFMAWELEQHQKEGGQNG
jgi:hypothetical protein